MVVCFMTKAGWALIYWRLNVKVPLELRTSRKLKTFLGPFRFLKMLSWYMTTFNYFANRQTLAGFPQHEPTLQKWTTSVEMKLNQNDSIYSICSRWSNKDRYQYTEQFNMYKGEFRKGQLFFGNFDVKPLWHQSTEVTFDVEKCNRIK